MRPVALRTLVTTALLTLSALAHAEPGSMGFAVKIETDGFFSTVLKSATIDKVVPGSPADKAGMAAGDQIVEIEGHAVVGANGLSLKPYLQREAGQATQMALRSPKGEVRRITIVPVPRAR